MGWDNRFKRVLITKKDYIPVGNPSEYQFRGGRFYRNGQAVELQDTSHSRTSRSPLDITA